MKNIFLIGMMGAGKSAVGRSLARSLGAHFVDMDHLIVERTGKSINLIFAEDGEPFFRDLETEILKEISAKRGQVVATGGGIVLKPENVQMMKSAGKIIFLEAKAETLWERVQLKTDRPLLKTETPRETLEAIYHQREPLYRQCADEVVVSEGKSFHDVAHEIMNLHVEKR